MYAEKIMPLTNRTGADLQVCWRREIRPVDLAGIAEKYGLRVAGYESCDELKFQTPVPEDRALIAAWSLEQFPLTPGAYGFLVFNKPSDGMINTGYYGDPVPFLKYSGNRVDFRFESPAKLQIGADAKAGPRFIGAYIPERDLLILRETVVQPEATYIDIADNEQAAGPFAAGDAYSIFYGADLNFFELETIAPVDRGHGLVRGSSLCSRLNGSSLCALLGGLCLLGNSLFNRACNEVHDNTKNDKYDEEYETEKHGAYKGRCKSDYKTDRTLKSGQHRCNV